MCSDGGWSWNQISILNLKGNGLPQSSNGQTSRTRITTVDQETLKARLYFPAEKRQVGIIALTG